MVGVGEISELEALHHLEKLMFAHEPFAGSIVEVARGD
jgi:hypothetical protein